MDFRKFIEDTAVATFGTVQKPFVVKEWDAFNPSHPAGSVVLYHGVLHTVVDAKEQGLRLAALTGETETKWECPYCGNQLKGQIQPNEACCGEAGHAQEVTYKEYPCGCEAGPAAEVPDYCPEHGAPN